MTTKIGGKQKGKMQTHWSLTTNNQGTRSYVTTNVDVNLMRILEFWAPILVSEKKITNNSSYAASRYVLEMGIKGLDAVMREKYKQGPQIETDEQEETNA
jgi:hypothetical protein